MRFIQTFSYRNSGLDAEQTLSPPRLPSRTRMRGRGKRVSQATNAILWVDGLSFPSICFEQQSGFQMVSVFC